MLLRALATIITLPLCSAAAEADSFKFVALGDMPYGRPAKVYPPYKELIKTVNERKPAFVVHVGDTKSGSTPCDNETLDAQLDFLRSFEPAAVYTPGDNEWTDCHRKKAGEFKPRKRLKYIRKTYFKNPSQSFGTNPFPVESQSTVMGADYKKFVENIRFEINGVFFVLAHVVGSNNNRKAPESSATKEFLERDAANIAWLDSGFKLAQNSNAAALVLCIHADMFDRDSGPPWDPQSFPSNSGFAKFAQALNRNAVAFEKPVLLIFGDSHTFRIFRPFPTTAPNITALEVYGAKNMHAVEVSVDTDDPVTFGFRPIFNPAVGAN